MTERESKLIALVDRRLAEIAKTRKGLDAEEADLIATKRTALRLLAEDDAGSEHKIQRRIARMRPSEARGNGHLSQKDMIIGTLRVLPHIWVKDAPTLQQKIEEIHKVRIKMTSLSPYLSDLKGKGVILRDNMAIALAERAKAREGTVQ